MYLIDIINKILNIYSMVHKIKLNEEKKKNINMFTLNYMYKKKKKKIHSKNNKTKKQT